MVVFWRFGTNVIEDPNISVEGRLAGPKAWTAPSAILDLGGAAWASGLGHPLFGWNLQGVPEAGRPLRPAIPAPVDDLKLVCEESWEGTNLS